MSAPGAVERPGVVLDTNVVLDWLLFCDPRSAALQAAVEAGALRWRVSPRMRDEFARTLTYPTLQKWKPDSERMLTSFDRWALPAPAEPAPSPLPLRCDDPDDQVFVDLALAVGARWLVSHDKALLRLRRRAAAFGLQIVSPVAWTAA